LSSARFPRRAFLGAALGALAPSVSFAQSPDGDHGRVSPPLAAPDIPVIEHDGASVRLPALVKGRATALQFMFTSCTVTCPIQGAIFARVQTLIPDQVARGVQLLSLSVDPRNDTPEALRRWLQRFHAGPGWIAAAPLVKDVERVRALGGPGRTPTDNHSTQVHILNRDGLLVWRTFELPEAEEIAGLLNKVSA
jgi:protein SCO1/2